MAGIVNRHMFIAGGDVGQNSGPVAVEIEIGVKGDIAESLCMREPDRRPGEGGKQEADRRDGEYDQPQEPFYHFPR